jgi:hypothetical protein
MARSTLHTAMSPGFTLGSPAARAMIFSERVAAMGVLNVRTNLARFAFAQ